MKFDINEIKEVHKDLENILYKTNLIKSEHFSRLYNKNIYFKPENLQITGSFKIRGAFNKIKKLNDKNIDIITASAGNHAQGVALASSYFNIQSTIVMPENTPKIKVQKTKNYGGNVILHGSNFDDAKKHAEYLAETKNMYMVHPFNDIDVIKGQATIGLEILDELQNVDTIIIPVGGGGLISGISMYAKLINPSIKIIGVEPKYYDSMKTSIENDLITNITTTEETIADGTAVKMPGNITYEICKKYVDQWISISDRQLLKVFIDMVENHKLIAEGSGLLSIAALQYLDESSKNIVCIISGGNIDTKMISNMIEKGLVEQERIKEFTLKLKDKPGELQKIIEIMTKNNANIISVHHDRYSSLNEIGSVVLKIKIETFGPSDTQKIKDELYGFIYDTVHS